MVMGRNRMKGISRACLVLMWVSLLCMPAAGYGEEIEVAIRIAPSTLNLSSNGQVVTVHTDILYDDVDVLSVYLNGVAIESWKADDCGYFVAKFSRDEIQKIDGLITGDYNTLQLLGATVNGDTFLGADEIMVIDPPAEGSDNDNGNRYGQNKE